MDVCYSCCSYFVMKWSLQRVKKYENQSNQTKNTIVNTMPFYSYWQSCGLYDISYYLSVPYLPVSLSGSNIKSITFYFCDLGSFRCKTSFCLMQIFIWNGEKAFLCLCTFSPVSLELNVKVGLESTECFLFQKRPGT